jgi:ABC-type sugar transport system substrate-binding protein
VTRLPASTGWERRSLRLECSPALRHDTGLGGHDDERRQGGTNMLRSVVMGLGAALLATSAMAQSRWDGADELPVSPLACGAGGAAAAAAKPYDGGQPTGAPDRAGKPLTVVDVPKLIGIGYFNATSKGMQDAAKELGNVTVTTDGPTKANIDEQITFIDNYVTRGVDGILFAANDPVAIAPVLKKALEKGINVVGYDANSTPDARQWFVNQAEFNGIGKALVDQMAAEIGQDGAFAIVTSTFTTPNQARWIAEMQAYQEACYPNMKWLETVEAQEDNILSFNQASTLINKYGDELKGIFGMTSVATPASAEAVTQAGQCGKIAVVGLATPNAMKPYVEKDCVKSVVLWNPVDLGYAATYVLRAVADGKLQPGATDVAAGKLGNLQVVNGSEILLGPPFVFSKANIGEFDF